MRYRGAQIYLWARGSCCLSRHYLPGRIAQVLSYSTEPPSRPHPPTNPSPPEQGTADVVKERTLRAGTAVESEVGTDRHRHSELLGRLKEVRDRLDRVSREEPHYLELATMEHKLLQEERRLRTAYENSESSEREKFALFSAAVRESHEKERTRAERTKNWSVIGSVLGALIGVMGSTYINRVRLQVEREADILCAH
ncbi:hypothetical protein GOODEAATRI_024548 [Goodea atripinnis]|uniref:Uncharacterized protein n=1 Tax=Goodea atripinnis TaxID=208336 RepID=A0ABV0PRB6_9TELE